MVSMSRAASLLVLIPLTPILMGASGTTLKTGTGSTMTGTILTAKEADTENTARERSVRSFATNIKEWNLIRQAWRSFDMQEDTAALADRTQCRADIRQANRETLLETQVRCFRREMSTWRTRLLKQEAFVTRTPGLLPGMTTVVEKKSKELREAINAVITAVDNNVFKTEAQMIEVKRNVRTKYYAPLKTALDGMRKAELKFLNAWIVTMIDAADDGVNVLDRESWDYARACFTKLENEKDMMVSTHSSLLLGCMTALQYAIADQEVPVETGTGSLLQTGTGSSQQ